MKLNCPQCGGEVQVTETRKRWWTLVQGDEPGTFEANHYGYEDTPSLHVYCENDHDIPINDGDFVAIAEAIDRAARYD